MKRRTDVHLKQAKHKGTENVSRRESQKFNETEIVTSRHFEDASEPLASPTLQDLRQGRFPSRLILTQFLHHQDCRETFITSPFSLFLEKHFPSVLKRRPRSGVRENKTTESFHAPAVLISRRKVSGCDLFAGSDAVNAQVGSFFFYWLRVSRRWTFLIRLSQDVRDELRNVLRRNLGSLFTVMKHEIEFFECFLVNGTLKVPFPDALTRAI